MPATPPSDRKRIAYDLWCIQEDRRMAGQPLENLDALVRALREQQPQLPDAALHQGVEHFLAWALAETAARLAGRQRALVQVHRGPIPARPKSPRREREGSRLDRVSGEHWR